MTQKSRLLLFTSTLVLGTILVAGVIGYKVGANYFEENAQQRLQQARQYKARELQNDFARLNQELLSTAALPVLSDFLRKAPAEQQEIRNWLRSYGRESSWRSAIIENHDLTDSAEAIRALSQISPVATYLQARFLSAAEAQNKKIKDVDNVSGTNLAYFKSHQSIHLLLRDTMERNNLADILLVEPSGNVVYSVKKDLNYGANLITGVFANSRLAQAFRWSLNAPEGASKFFDFAPMTHFWNLPAGFLVTPIFSHSRHIGTVMFQIPLDRVDGLLSNQSNWDGLGLQRTGEIVAFGSEGLMRNNSRFFFESPQKFLREYQHNDSTGTVEMIRQSRSTALLVGLPDEKLHKYQETPELVEITHDYAGNKALQSVGKVTLPGNTEWYLIAKMNEKEALAPLANHFKWLSLAALFILGVALWAARRFAVHLFRPLHNLAEGLSHLRKADYSFRLPVPEKSEFKPLFENYNEVSEDFHKAALARDFLESAVQSLHEALFFVEINEEPRNGKVPLRIRGINPAAAEMVGVKGTSLKGTDLSMWIDTDYKRIFASWRTRRQDQPESFTVEGVLKKISGERVPLELSWAKISKGNILVLIGRDITWKKEIEKELKLKETLLKESQLLSKTGSFRWEINTGKCVWSEEEFRLLGFDPATTQPTYDLLRSVIYGEDLPEFDEALEEAYKNIRPFNHDFRIKKKDTGEIIWLRAQGRIEYDDYGNPLFMYGITQDITELRRAEQSLIAAKNDALKSSQAKSEFLARMSHEIRTPMNAIMGMAELLKETKMTPDQEYYISIFSKAGEVLMALINDILDLSKIEAGEVSIENIPFDLRKLLEDVEDMMKPRALEKGVNYSFEVSHGVSTYLMGDPTKLRQVLINLVSNSLKFTESGYIRVAITKNPSKKDTLMVSVSDSGVGIPASKQHLIFQKFSQADSSITRRFGGTGLGLAISKSLVELMGGQIWFKSRENVGTTFFFTIPYREQVYNPMTHRPLQMQRADLDFTAPKHHDPNKKIRILIADDTEDNRTLFTHYLKNGPYEIIEAENGLEAIDKIKSGQFDIVFMDVQMPEKDGYAATHEIREWEEQNHKPHTPIIALTAHALSEDRQKSLRAGCDDHIAKPFKKDTLLDVINRYSL